MDAGIRCKLDARWQYSPPWKFNHWELKGVPIRIEIGPRDLQKGECVAVRRDTGTKEPVKLDTFKETIGNLLKTIQSDMFNRAKAARDSRLAVVETWDDFMTNVNRKNLVQSPFCNV